ncbi:MCP four helix bundle domain-containing protein [Undibacterium jejuense]|uniref:MCP four helix bundle domain-containing protein n=1 Tax=Undibacterium jejuense TaxID=1344949 RepID=A0A923HAE2_9BURK|nr:methyl-accepting chemotaxis protein [Undibacterium jejuense]MBC3860737.1 MCP four helix bundle domain-containing protein [Undibacterium jejuense]
MKIEDTKVSTRLIAGFGLVLGFLLLVLGLGIMNLQQMHARMDQIVKFNDEETRFARVMYLSVTERALALRNLILLKEDEGKKIEHERILDQQKKYHDAADQLEALLKKDADPTALQLSLLKEMKEQATLSEPYIAKGMGLALGGQPEEAYKYLRYEYRPVQKKWWDLINAFIDDEESQNKVAVKEAEDQYVSTRNTMLILGVLALLVGTLAAWLIVRSLLKQLGGEPRYAVQIAEKIAAGDLGMEIRLDHGDEHSLMYAMNAMRNGLSDIVGMVRTGTETIATASKQIASGNMDLSSRSEQQAGSLEETASSMEELTSTVKQNADSARQANQLAMSASDVAVKGGHVVSEVVQTMGSINDSSHKIVDIIGVIDSIAFQTNILALNAAVEAARAGEQGRGFAVVASEVRSLAQRSAEAAREIKKLIDDSVNKVATGTKLVDQAGVTMEEIVTSIQKVTGIMSEIMLATQEQTAGIEQINEAIVQMDDVTQQNAALVEEAAAAATALQDQADNLSDLVSTFQLAGNQQGSVLANATHEAVPKSDVRKVVPLVKKAESKVKSTPPLKQIKRLANTKASNSHNQVMEDWDEF